MDLNCHDVIMPTSIEPQLCQKPVANQFAPNIDVKAQLDVIRPAVMPHTSDLTMWQRPTSAAAECRPTANSSTARNTRDACMHTGQQRCDQNCTSVSGSLCFRVLDPEPLWACTSATSFFSSTGWGIAAAALHFSSASAMTLFSGRPRLLSI